MGNDMIQATKDIINATKVLMTTVVSKVIAAM
jgi:hypothetical protein